jgi:glycosyltransferase involved in cell wall biosynthesis
VPDLSVVIPTYRRPDALPRTLDALERQTLAADRFEVIVVDDPDADDSSAVAEIVRAPSRPFAARHLSRAQPGVSAARNVGWRAASAPVVVFIGDDILLRPDGLERHLAGHTREPDESVGVLGLVVWARELKVTPFMRWLEEGIEFDFRFIFDGETSWPHFYTSNVSVKRSLLERVDGFDEERFPFLYEDLDVGYRMAEHGLRLIFDRHAVGEHLHQVTFEDFRRRMTATADAERKWIEIHPELEPYFHDRFAEAAAGPPGSALAARALGLVPRRLPILGERVWASADRYFCRALGGPFLAAWSGPAKSS